MKTLVLSEVYLELRPGLHIALY